MAQEGQPGSEWSPWRRGWLLPAIAWIFRIIAVALIGYGIYGLAMHTAGIGTWKYGRAWSLLSPICTGGWMLVMTFAWRARTRKRAIVLLCIAALFIVMGVAMVVADASRRQDGPPAELTGSSALQDKATPEGGSRALASGPWLRQVASCASCGDASGGGITYAGIDFQGTHRSHPQAPAG